MSMHNKSKEIHELGVQIGIVIGGGNIFRGLSGASKRFRPCERRPNGNARNRYQ